MAKLNPRQRLFASEYIVDFNRKAAAIRAGYSEKGADTQSYRLLKNEAVKAEIEAYLEKRRRENEITAERVANELALLG